MASVFIVGLADIDYSLTDGRVRSFELRGETLFDEYGGIAVPGWEKELMAVILSQALHIDHDGHGLHAFVQPFLDKCRREGQS